MKKWDFRDRRKSCEGSGDRVGQGGSFKPETRNLPQGEEFLSRASRNSGSEQRKFRSADLKLQKPSCVPAFLGQLCRYAAGKRTSFFLPRPRMFVGGTNVTSTYFLAQATRSRLQLRSSLCLMFSRWLSMVLTLRFSECAI